MENVKKALNLLKEESFLESLADLNSAEEIKAAFGENGIELSVDDVVAINKAIAEISNEEDVELDADKLDEVSGGLQRYIDAWNYGKKAAAWFIKQEKKLYKALGLKW